MFRRIYLSLGVIITMFLPCHVLAFDVVPPESPGPEEWPFLEDLASPLPFKAHWTRTEGASGEANLGGGVRVEAAFPDPDGILETAYADLDNFFGSVGVPDDGAYRIITEQIETEKFETFKLAVSENECRIQANDTEGIRRGIFFLEDELLRAEGPFLPLGEKKRSPFIRNRISRCFFGPIKRPPKHKDELMDDVNYYPEHYLNKLAHDGVNGLWLTIEFMDICKTSLIPEVDPDRAKRLAKLRKTVATCRRYGIDVYIFCIEPRVMGSNHPLLTAHPELGGMTVGRGSKLFCPFPEISQTYLYEAVNDIFTEVPNLGGLINISFGERSTTCLSGADKYWKINCPICKDKEPGEILGASMSAMARGMHDANPKAQLVSWLYVPENGTGIPRDLTPLRNLAKHTPPGVITQINFESGGTKTQLGKDRHAGDYWLSYVGPSAIYLDTAAGVGESPGELGAKLQACNSFEASTIPYVPAPSNLFQKYSTMRELGVTSVMQCWYIGNLPSVMNRAAASHLPFAPEGLSEDDFLLELAQRDWGPSHAPEVVRAWRLFTEAYDHYPLTNAMQYYGPMHDGIGWQLHLKPVHVNLSPVWKLEYPPAGDRIGEAFSGSHTLDEMLALCGRMSDTWQEGLKVLSGLKPTFASEPNRVLDITTAEALGLHFRTGYNIFRFYDRREKLLYGPLDERAAILEEIRAIVEEEIANATAMKGLFAQNPYLGFQAEAEGYQYFPGYLDWRIAQLRDVLNTEVPEAATAIASGVPVYPTESGLAEQSHRYVATAAPSDISERWREDGSVWESLPHEQSVDPEFDWSWQATHDAEAIYVMVTAVQSEAWRPVAATVQIEPTHIYPRRSFYMTPYGKRGIQVAWLDKNAEWEAVGAVVGGKQTFRMRVPLASFRGEDDPSRPMRINVVLTFLAADKSRQTMRMWAPSSGDNLRSRLGYGNADPREMGWLVRQ
jgi:hypothetical protein